MRLDQSLFGSLANSPVVLIPSDSQIVFVSDLYPEDYVGGAELTLQALIDACPADLKYVKLRSGDVTQEHIKQGVDKHWIFGNYTQLDPRTLQQLAANVRYSIVECDYKFCQHRSVELHKVREGVDCDCDKKPHGQLIVSFMAGADQIWWMSETQRQVYLDRFPFLVDYHQSVLSSVFDDDFFATIKSLRESQPKKSDTWIIQDSASWIKNTEGAKQFAEQRGLTYETIGNVSHIDMLKKLIEARGLLFLPVGGDTCPRLVIEAKLLGCELILNDNVQHAHEDWFETQDLSQIEDYLSSSRDYFWHETRRHIEKRYTVSGYATTYNCVQQEYPFELSVKSMLGFCDEVVVVDGGSTDGTLDALKKLQVESSPTQSQLLLFSCVEDRDAHFNKVSKLKIHVVERDWNDPRSALFDGQQKAEARRRCSGDFVWQMDVDEVVRSEDWPKIRELVGNFPKAVPMLALPVVEYWGGFDKVRVDVTSWKWRVSRNSPRITHGVPIGLRDTDSEGRMIAKQGTDGCDPVDVNTGEPIVFLGFLTGEMAALQHEARNGNETALQHYESWFERVVQNVPSVYHLSWLDIERKIKLYKNFWSAHWQKLAGDDSGDTAENNMFFDKPWSEVTDEDIAARAKELAEQTGGHVFHAKFQGRKTPWMTLKNVSVPREIQDVVASKNCSSST